MWVPKQSWSISETMQQQCQQQISQIKETFKFVGLLTFHDILTEHEKDVKILQEVTLDILMKASMNKYKAKYALDIITNYLN